MTRLFVRIFTALHNPCRLIRFASAPLAAICLAVPVALAQTEQRLEVVDSTEDPWPSIGRVNVAGHRTTSMCTGTLIAPNIVLTAAHCFYNKRTLKLFPTKDVLFIAGVRRDQFAARLEAACLITAKDYQPKKQPRLRDVRNDIGLIVLKQKSDLRPIAPLEIADAKTLSKETRFQSAGYRRSRRYLPTLVKDCKVLGTREDSWVTNCPSESGASGGPFLVETANGPRVAGVMSAKLNEERSVIVPFLEWQDLLKNPSCSADPTVKSSNESRN
ncbi:Trypsin [Labrenzia sp. THAF82]|uniref:trypsin-like serine peptidase n=1 Tax=Labrenzia sp. THAF82 TaxID=2587861 RepID=UPI001268A2EE|nr:trypsin-like serine protease [Labrenzia sp. THAF82]QFT31675.1 Trypsin [Labrenzia sp. THAF82]